MHLFRKKKTHSTFGIHLKFIFTLNLNTRLVFFSLLLLFLNAIFFSVFPGTCPFFTFFSARCVCLCVCVFALYTVYTKPPIEFIGKLYALHRKIYILSTIIAIEEKAVNIILLFNSNRYTYFVFQFGFTLFNLVPAICYFIFFHNKFGLGPGHLNI